MKFTEGTAIKISIIVNVATLSSCTITIDDPSDVSKVSSVNMTKEADRVYYYIWQSSDGDTAGTYKITINASFGGYTSRKQSLFELLDSD